MPAPRSPTSQTGAAVEAASRAWAVSRAASGDAPAIADAHKRMRNARYYEQAREFARIVARAVALGALALQLARAAAEAPS